MEYFCSCKIGVVHKISEMLIKGIELTYFGNINLLDLSKTAFLCSRKIPAAAVLKCYDWAIQMRDEGRCIIGGFHSPLEKDIFNILLKGEQPMIIVLAKSLPDKLNPAFKESIKNNRLLLISPFDKKITRASEKTASARNKLMIELAEEIVVGWKTKDGNIDRLLNQIERRVKLLT